MPRGRNLAESTVSKSYSISDNITIFISHISIDKKTAISIGDYIRGVGYNIYLDINDSELQQAVRDKDPDKITSCIEKGINRSSHMICLISDETKNSWWVPYEIGYGKKGDINLATLILKDTGEIPEFLEVTEILPGTKSLNKYLKTIAGEGLLSEKNIKKRQDRLNIKKHTEALHPLDAYLNWAK